MNRSPSIAAIILLPLLGSACKSPQGSPALQQSERFELPEPGPMLPPVPAIVLGVQGDETKPDDLTVVWTYVLNGNPPQIGISVGDDSAITGHKHAALELIQKQREFTLNVPDASWIEQFDGIDMTASTRADKFAANGLTRLPSKVIGAPGIAEAAIVLECRVLQEHRLPPSRTVFFAEVLRASVHPGVTDADGRLDSQARESFGMTSGNGEFWSFGRKVGRIGMTVGREDIRY
ncbi:MAG: flavin reductase family protein [Planctomycetota bacterium]|jgi:flavin reductase (DIM6/NTAB) family NADH-FMN oxidoreductase RutF